MKYEDILEKIGSFGRFQKWLCFYLVLSGVPNGYLVLSIVFVGITPPHRCYLPEIDGLKSNTSFLAKEDFDNDLIRLYVPADDEGALKQCDVYKISGPVNSTISSNHSKETSKCPNGWVYESTGGRTTYVTEWDIVCDRSWIQPTVSFLFMIGVLTGSLASGIVSDRVGRRPVFLAGTFAMFVLFGACGLASSSPVYMALMFFAGATNMINYMAAFVIASEIMNTKNRVVVGTLTIGGFALGYMVIPLVAYCVKDWRVIYIATGISGVLFIPYYWLIPESPRWLHCQGKMSEFQTLIRKIAKTNGLSENDITHLLKELMVKNNKDDSLSMSYSPTRSMIKHLKSKTVIFITASICFTWFTSAVIYYGISFNTSNLGGSPYLNCFVAAAVEIPAYVLVILIHQRIGRKPLMISTMVLSGVACGATPFLGQVSSNLAIAVAMLGKFAISATFDLVYIYTAELFPTSIRNSAVGGTSIFARLGASISSYVMYLDKVNIYLPYVLMMILGILSGLLTLLLPETRGLPMPETLEDMEERSKFKRNKTILIEASP